MPESTDTDYTHLDMTPEYNRIITALTGIRDDVRLLQKLQSDPESGIATSNVLNDFQRALLAVSMSSAVLPTAELIVTAKSARWKSFSTALVAMPLSGSDCNFCNNLTSSRMPVSAVIIRLYSGVMSKC